MRRLNHGSRAARARRTAAYSNDGLHRRTRSEQMHGSRLFAFAILSLEHVLDVVLEKKKIRRRLAINLQRTLVIPLNRALYLFAVPKDYDHKSMRVNLLL